jgi:glycosyltransferase involved in cell wall biosynthesis
MKIAVYTIAKNEEKFAKRWADSAKDADYRIVLDTGSTDQTVSILRKSGVSVKKQIISPWRFDVARNMSLRLVPRDADVCICLDMDEVLVPGWRKTLEDLYLQDINADRFRYKYVWSWIGDKPDLIYYGDKIHKRNDYRWKHPVHEVLAFDGTEVQSKTEEILIEHYPDTTKSRGQYFDLLKLAVEEEPEDDRNSHYLGREYFYHQMYQEAIDELSRHLTLRSAKWNAERAASLRYISKCYQLLGNIKNAKKFAYEACLECDSRESWLWFTKLLYGTRDYSGAIWAATRHNSLGISDNVYLSERETRNHSIHDMLAVAYYQTGNLDKWEEHTRIALELVDNNEDKSRLEKNLAEYAKSYK